MRSSRAATAIAIFALVVAACTADPAETGPAETGAAETGAAETGAAETGAAETTGTVRIGSPAPGVDSVPMYMAIERLGEMGYDIEVIEFASTETEMQAAAQGDVDITHATVGAVLGAIDAGLENNFFLGRYMLLSQLSSRADLTTCESLDGENVGLHARGNTSALLYYNYVETNCPGIEANILIVEGSENRLIALLEGQVAASPLDPLNTQLLLLERPDDFHVLTNLPGGDTPLVSAAYTASPEWLSANEAFVKDFIRVHLDVHDEIYADPDAFVEECLEQLPEVDPDLLPGICLSYLDNEIFPRDGDLGETMETTVEFFTDIGGFTQIPDYEDLVDRSYLDEVLAEN